MLQGPRNKRPFGADDERHSGRQLLIGDGTFNVKSIPICDGATPIDVAKIALNHSEVAIYQDDGSGVSDTK